MSSSFNLGRAFVQSGPFGWFAVVATLVLLIVGGAMLASHRSRRAFGVLLLASLLPGLAGAAGTLFGFMIVDRVAEEKNITEAEAERGRKQAMLPVRMGGIGTLLLVGLASIGFVQGQRTN